MRCDAGPLPRLIARSLVPWNSDKYKFVLPPAIESMLRLDEHLLDVYGDIGLLPVSKRRFSVTTAGAQPSCS